MGNNPEDIASTPAAERVRLSSLSDPSLSGLARLRGWCSAGRVRRRRCPLRPTARRALQPAEIFVLKTRARNLCLPYRALRRCASLPTLKKKNQKCSLPKSNHLFSNTLIFERTKFSHPPLLTFKCLSLQKPHGASPTDKCGLGLTVLVDLLGRLPAPGPA